MFLLVFLLIATVVLAFILLAVVLFTSLRLNIGDKSASLESGFYFRDNTQSSFSLQFLGLCIFFVIFDLELIIVLPTLFVSTSGSIMFYLVLTFVLLTLAMEYSWGNLVWFT